ncbi:dolichol kinase [Conoideocrella luteorostrata]|uniref:dolichol kinase n=1 Tax=Conoideocrella luteorostrata TaxID=1105319 RepID=A0AAJ0CKB4_9HYPO|nr:dolichol kinase [Conoideocrella luteorostrata]
MSEASRTESLMPPDPGQQDELRALNRTPHPYHHQSSELPHPSDRFTTVHRDGSHDANHDSARLSPTGFPIFSKESTSASDSGTEADDEHFLKGLPAPKVRLHKGLRDVDDPISGVSTPLPSPAILQDERIQGISEILTSRRDAPKKRSSDVWRRNRILVRRATEAGIVASLGYMVVTSSHVTPLFRIWSKDFQYLSWLYGALMALYPLRVLVWSYGWKRPSVWLPLRIPSNFDPAPLLYPPAITMFVSLLVARSNPGTVLSSIILSIGSLPQALIPQIDRTASYDVLHWALTLLPLVWGSRTLDSSRFNPTYSFVTGEALVLLYPVHQTLCIVLHHLTTTSLLTAELQLLSIALINVLILSASPQAKILKGLLWGGGLAVLVFCGPVIRWGIALARVPKWRFRKPANSQKYRFWKDIRKLLSWHRIKNDVVGAVREDNLYETSSSVDEEDEVPLFSAPLRVQTIGPTADIKTAHDTISTTSSMSRPDEFGGIARRHTMPHPDQPLRKRSSHTPSGRRKRTASISVRPYIRLTQGQATMRKWTYAAYVYACLLGIILIGVRTYVERYALNGFEPIGWALGYMFGGLPWFRFHVVRANLERWICLPVRVTDVVDKHCHLGWVEHLRHSSFGEANTRLILSAYWFTILVFGLVVVFQLKETYEVDTRRKVFHFMMVGMFLPAAYVDPTYAGLALSLILAIFLILDLLRASQLPPLSKPIASFLAPYVDGRDFRGPVVISHIFLLIGCAIPLWLALASLARTGTGCLAGWEVPSRDVSMVSGVICVGLGDAAASLFGRRYGRRKWIWGGGKSLEGSVAFAVAVFIGLAAAGLWLRVGGWPMTDEPAGVLASARNAGICSSMASLTEAVLTGGNDNVIVPVVLWTCVKSLGI